MRLTTLAFTVIVGAVGLLASQTRPPDVASNANATGIRTFGVAGRSNENLSTATLGRSVAMVFSSAGSAGTDVFAIVSRDGGTTFSSPVRVNATAGEASVGGEQPPRVALSTTGSGMLRIDVVWTAKGANGTRLLTARSIDDGRTFGKTTTVPGSDAAGNRGWESIATNNKGQTIALWLDHRNLASASSGMTHEHGAATTPSPSTQAATRAAAVERAGQSQLYFASLDGSTPARALTGGVCYCCKTSLVTGADGGVYAVWRHVYQGSERDIAFAMSRDGGKTFAPPVRVSRDGWAIEGCPENGPAIAVDAQRNIHVVWPTLVRERGSESLALFHAMSRDGVTFSARTRLPSPVAAYHPQMALERDGTVVVAWDEAAAGGRRIAVARGKLNASGSISFARVERPEWSGVYPSVVTTDAGASIAWVRRAASGSTIALAPLAR